MNKYRTRTRSAGNVNSPEMKTKKLPKGNERMSSIAH
jgi:hypothetical protein